MKNLPFLRRAAHAASGIRHAAQSEASFRTQVALAAAVLAGCLALRPSPLWWALLTLVIGLVLAAELFNTALERVIDRLHPELHPLMKQAKDCASGAVLVLSITALAVAAACLTETFLKGSS